MRALKGNTMKRIFCILPLLLLAVSCDWFELDNEDSWDASIEGRFLDSKTGEPVQLGYTTSSSFSIYELGWDGEEAQTWYAKPNGTYVNKLAWAGDYRIQSTSSNYYPLTEEFTIAKGANDKDFTVTPYARVIDPSISYDAASHRLVARFKVEYGDAAKTTSMKVKLFGFTDRFVSQSFDNFTDASTKLEYGVPTDGTTEVTLYVDVTDKSANNSQFQYNRTHYLRIGACATGVDWATWTFVNASANYNYSPVYAVSKDFSSITEVTDWTAE